MNAQDILTAVFHAVTISFTLLILYCEICQVILYNQELKVLDRKEELETTATNSISQQTTSTVKLESPVAEEHIELTEFRSFLKPLRKPKEQAEFIKMTPEQLRKKCQENGIRWRNVVRDKETGKIRHLRKAEMVAALQQKLSNTLTNRSLNYIY